MPLKFLLIAITLGICGSAVQGQTTTALPTVPIWGACGGILCSTPCGNCAEGSVCVKANEFYSQCLPVVISTTTAQPTPTGA